MGVDVAALERTIPADSTLLLDTNVLIAYLEGGERITDAAEIIVDRWVREGRNHAMVSVVTAMELLVGPMRAGRGHEDVSDFLLRFPNVHVAPLDFAAALHAAQLRAHHRLKPPDALIVGTGIATGADAIVTNDGYWKTKSPIPVVTLSQFVS